MGPRELGTVCVLVGVMAGVACSAPDASDAQRWYHHHKATIDRIDNDVRAGVSAIPEISGARFVCPPAPAPASPHPPTGAIPGLGALVDQARCQDAELRWIEARDEKVRRFDEDVLVTLLRLPGVIGVVVTYRRPGDSGPQRLGEVGLTPGGLMNGHVAAKDGTSLDGRMLGWGQYQTAFASACGSFGDGEGRAGIEVAWDVREGDTAFHVEVFILAEDTVDDAWRAGVVCQGPVP